MEINYLKPKSLDEVIKLHKQIFKEDNKTFFENLKTKNYYHVFVAEHNSKVVAYCIISEILGDGEVINIATIDGYKQKGIAKNLLLFALKNIDYNKCFLEVATKNIAAIRLYKACGFIEISRRQKYYGDDDAIIMQKTKET